MGTIKIIDGVIKELEFLQSISKEYPEKLLILNAKIDVLVELKERIKIQKQKEDEKKYSFFKEFWNKKVPLGFDINAKLNLE